MSTHKERKERTGQDSTGVVRYSVRREYLHQSHVFLMHPVLCDVRQEREREICSVV